MKCYLKEISSLLLQDEAVHYTITKSWNFILCTASLKEIEDCGVTYVDGVITAMCVSFW